MTDSVNDVLTRAEGIFKDLVWDALVKAALARLFVAVPWLGWGPIGAVVGMVVTMFATKLFEALKLSLDLQVIKFLNTEHQKAFNLESVRLAVVAKEHGIDSPQFKEANEKAKAALLAFVRFTGK